MALADAISSMLVCAAVLLVIATALLLWPRSDSRPRTFEGLVPAVAGVAAIAMLGIALLGGGPALAALTAVLLAGSVVALALSVPGWSRRGLLVGALGVDTLLLYLAHGTTRLWDAAEMATPGSAVVVALELVALLVAVGLLAEIVDRLARRDERPGAPAADAGPAASRPLVSLHVPVVATTPDAVLTTLSSLGELDHDRLEILVVVPDCEDSWHAVEMRCAGDPRLRLVRPAVASGVGAALNEALRQTDPRAELVGVVEPGDVPASGAHHLLPRRELLAAGGWDEWSALPLEEMVLRLRRDGGDVRGGGPAAGQTDFTARRRGGRRAAMGGVQNLRLHWRSLMPWDMSSHNHLAAGARQASLAAGLRWCGDVAAVALTAVLAVAAVDLALGSGATVEHNVELLVAVSVAVSVLGLLRHRGGSSWRDRTTSFT